MSFEQAQERLWELLLGTHANSYRDATAEQVRAWLAWLATGMQRTRRQRFMLHELYLFDPELATNFRSFRITVGLVVGLVFGLIGDLVVGLATSRG